MQENTLTDIENTIKTLTETFENFTQKSEKKMNQLYVAKSAVPLSTPEDIMEHDEQRHHFKNFVTKGLMSKSALTSNTNGGGYLIPQFVTQNIQSQLQTTSSLRSIAQVTEISTDTYDILLDQGDTHVGWAGEIEERTDTDLPDLRKIQITTHELYAKPKVSQKVLDDSHIDIEEWIGQKIAESMSASENIAFIRGDGEKKPKGILSYPMSSDDKEDHLQVFKTGVAGGIKDADILMQVVDALPAAMLPGACWLMSRSALSVIRTLRDNTKRYLLQPALSEGMPHTLLGFPVVLNDALDQVKDGVDSKPVLFGNFKQGYQIVDRADVSLLRDPYSSKPFVEFYATKRVGGGVVNAKAIKVLEFSA